MLRICSIYEVYVTRHLYDKILLRENLNVYDLNKNLKSGSDFCETN